VSEPQCRVCGQPRSRGCEDPEYCEWQTFVELGSCDPAAMAELMRDEYILLEPEELDPGKELCTLEDDPDPPPQIDHTVLDVQSAIHARDHLQFLTEDRLICGIPLRVSPEGPYYAIHLTKVFAWIEGEWRTADDRVIVGPLGGEQS